MEYGQTFTPNCDPRSETPMHDVVSMLYDISEKVTNSMLYDISKKVINLSEKVTNLSEKVTNISIRQHQTDARLNSMIEESHLRQQGREHRTFGGEPLIEVQSTLTNLEEDQATFSRELLKFNEQVQGKENFTLEELQGNIAHPSTRDTLVDCGDTLSLKYSYDIDTFLSCNEKNSFGLQLARSACALLDDSSSLFNESLASDLCDVESYDTPPLWDDACDDSFDSTLTLLEESFDLYGEMSQEECVDDSFDSIFILLAKRFNFYGEMSKFFYSFGLHRTFRPGFLETMGSNPSRGKRLGGIEKLLMMDTSCDMVKLCKDAEQQMPNDNIETSYIIGDEEYLPVKENSVDLVISCLGLHWTNDLPGAMIQCRLALKSDGLFLAAILGGETLKELRIACTVAQMEREGGIRPRLSPLAQVRDAGNLLTRAGLTLPGVDVDEYTV
ncbi:putative methyltransferase [Nicotiana attenuata]|uniref:Methyltransferase n=1 Tax=Nicotiana attenuata TaxID=49451 RepID=A0A1J6IE13_NICAT|nr:putative methyltransferase [Nicotiana attenuata]